MGGGVLMLVMMDDDSQVDSRSRFKNFIYLYRICREINAQRNVQNNAIDGSILNIYNIYRKKQGKKTGMRNRYINIRIPVFVYF